MGLERVTELLNAVEDDGQERHRNTGHWFLYLKICGVMRRPEIFFFKLPILNQGKKNDRREGERGRIKIHRYLAVRRL